MRFTPMAIFFLPFFSNSKRSWLVKRSLLRLQTNSATYLAFGPFSRRMRIHNGRCVPDAGIVEMLWTITARVSKLKDTSTCAFPSRNLFLDFQKTNVLTGTLVARGAGRTQVVADLILGFNYDWGMCKSWHLQSWPALRTPFRCIGSLLEMLWSGLVTRTSSRLSRCTKINNVKITIIIIINKK